MQFFPVLIQLIASYTEQPHPFIKRLIIFFVISAIIFYRLELYQELSKDASLKNTEIEKLKIEWFKAETERIKVLRQFEFKGGDKAPEIEPYVITP